MSIPRYFIITVFLFSMLTATAQFKKGDRMLGATIGSVLINSGSSDITVALIGSNTSKITSYTVSITPLMGWFLSDRTAVGVTLLINPNGNKTTYEQNGSTYQSDKVNGNNMGLGIFTRHYFTGKNLFPFVQLSLNSGISSLKTEGFFYGGSGGSAYKLTYTGNASGGFFMNATLAAGLTKMLSSITGIDFYAGYVYSYSKNTFKKTTLRDTPPERMENQTTTKFTNNGFLLGAGIQVFISRKK